jgi:ribonucleoside-diphosphate reductase alpha chain
MQPSTGAYIARLLIHRYNMLGILDPGGYPINGLGLLKETTEVSESDKVVNLPVAGKVCEECSVPAVIKRDGCDFCTACGHIGACG